MEVASVSGGEDAGDVVVAGSDDSSAEADESPV